MTSPNKSKTFNVLLRLPLSIYERIKAEADANRRTITAQIILTIERGLDRDGGGKS